jgi:hypothetical protein
LPRLAGASVAERGYKIMRAAGIEPAGAYPAIGLGSPGLLVFARRRRIIELRDHHRAAIDGRRRASRTRPGASPAKPPALTTCQAGSRRTRHEMAPGGRRPRVKGICRARRSRARAAGQVRLLSCRNPRAVRGAPARCGLWLEQPQPVVLGEVLEVLEIEGGERQLVGKAAGSNPGVVDRAGPPALGGRG